MLKGEVKDINGVTIKSVGRSFILR